MFKVQAVLLLFHVEISNILFWQKNNCQLVLLRPLQQEYRSVYSRSRWGSLTCSRHYPETARLRMLMSSAVTYISWEILGLMCIIQQMSIQLRKLVQAAHTLQSQGDLAIVPRVLEKIRTYYHFLLYKHPGVHLFCSQLIQGSAVWISLCFAVTPSFLTVQQQRLKCQTERRHWTVDIESILLVSASFLGFVSCFKHLIWKR